MSKKKAAKPGEAKKSISQKFRSNFLKHGKIIDNKLVKFVIGNLKFPSGYYYNFIEIIVLHSHQLVDHNRRLDLFYQKIRNQAIGILAGPNSPVALYYSQLPRISYH